MTLRLPFPASEDALRLADWCELDATIQADGNSSRSDVEEALALAGLFDGNRDRIEAAATDVFLELANRSDAAADAYPFRIEGALLRRKSTMDDFPAYMFCLCLSYFGYTPVTGDTRNPRRMFENLSCLAARNFLGGNALRFAFPRDEVPAHMRGLVKALPTTFREALRELCLQVGEGDYKPAATLSGLDRKLDVVAWRNFKDLRTGKLLMFGQCASGNDWEGKIYELNPLAICGEWMSGQPVSAILKAFFVPHRVPTDRWDYVSRHAGVIFDRCRLAYWLTQPTALPAKKPYLDWARSAIRGGAALATA